MLMNRIKYLFRLKRPAHARRGERGATAVEMAIIAPVFFMLMIGITETCLFLTAQQIMENAAFNTSRLAKTGFTTNGSTQLATITAVMNKEMSSFGQFFDTSKIKMTSTVYNNFSSIDQAGQGTSGLGDASQIVVYTITYPWVLFTPMLGNVIGTWDSESQHYVLNLSTRIVVRNEPYG